MAELLAVETGLLLLFREYLCRIAVCSTAAELDTSSLQLVTFRVGVRFLQVFVYGGGGVRV